MEIQCESKRLCFSGIQSRVSGKDGRCVGNASKLAESRDRQVGESSCAGAQAAELNRHGLWNNDGPKSIHQNVFLIEEHQIEQHGSVG